MNRSPRFRYAVASSRGHAASGSPSRGPAASGPRGPAASGSRDPAASGSRDYVAFGSSSRGIPGVDPRAGAYQENAIPGIPGQSPG
jgi:hypothetical protein